jgi:hypothetical protein
MPRAITMLITMVNASSVLAYELFHPGRYAMTAPTASSTLITASAALSMNAPTIGVRLATRAKRADANPFSRAAPAPPV